MSALLFKFSIALIIFYIFVKLTIKVITHRHHGILERFGKFVRVLKPGFHILIPIADRVAYQREMREQVIEVPPQHCVTRDNIDISVDGIVYLKVYDARLASYSISDYQFAAISLAQTTMRSEIGKLSLHQTFSERENLNLRIVEEIDKNSVSWGIKVLRYEIMNITPSFGVIQELEKAMEAERDRRAEVELATAEKEAVTLVSEGKRQEAINLSEGEQQSRINLATGRAKEISLIADATAYGIRRIAKAISSPSGMDAVHMRIIEQYIKEFVKVIQGGRITVVPADLANIKGFFEGFSKVSETFASNSQDQSRPNK